MAAAIPVLVVALVVALGVLDVARQRLACGDVLRVAARHLARGESPAQVHQVATPGLPRGATLQIETSGSTGSVRVVQPRTEVWLLTLPGCVVSAEVELE